MSNMHDKDLLLKYKQSQGTKKNKSPMGELLSQCHRNKQMTVKGNWDCKLQAELLDYQKPPEIPICQCCSVL